MGVFLSESLPYPDPFLQTEGLFLCNQSGLPGGGVLLKMSQT